MNDPPPCPQCGTPLTAGAMQALCPRCLLQLGMLGNNLEDGAVDPFVDAPREEPGTVIERYRLLEEIGEGGFGIVYLAEQTAPVKRKVALKILKPGMDTREIVARFEAERETLALMDHLHIAQVYDGGATANGRPYFVMELVKGTPITSYCADHGLSIRERLELFLDVAAAVGHAHQKGIIHRDLKPSNILVSEHDGKAVVKVIDFGIAKAVSMELADRKLVTAFGRMLGTPQYMSPEQAELNALDIDTRSDIYSLGVLLYELLTGTTPLDSATLHKAGFTEMQRLIREEKPVKPSLRVASRRQKKKPPGGEGGVTPKPGGAALARDIDWVVMQALEKDRSRRYQTANSLALDVRHFLDDEPVSASPPSTTYRFSKFAKRHRFGVAWTAIISVVVIAAAVGMTILYIQSVRDRQRAEENAQRAAEKTFEALVQQAAALRWSGKPGRRFEAFDALRKAAAIPFALRVPNNLKRLRDSTIACLAIIDMRPVDSWQGNADYGETVVPDGSLTRYAITFRDGRIAIHRYPDRSLMLDLPGDGQAVNPVLRFSPNGDGLAATYGTNQEWELKLWNLQKKPATFCAAGRGIHQAFDFFPDGKSCVIGRPDGSLAILDIATGKTLRQVSLTRAPHAVRISRDGKWLAVSLPGTGEQPDQVAILDAATGQPRTTPLACPARALAWSPVDDSLAVACTDHVLRVWHAQDWEAGALELRGHTGVADTVAWSPDGRLLASQCPDGTIRLWDPFLGTALSWHSGRGNGLAFSADGKRLGMLREGATLTVMEVEPGDVCYRGHGHSGETGTFDGVWNSKGTLMATSGDDGVRFWNREGRHLETLKVPQAQGLAFASVPSDALFVASATGLSRYPMVSEVTADGLVITFQAPEPIGSFRACMQVSLATNGKLLAVAGRRADRQDDAAAIWLVDLPQGTPPRRLGGPAGVAYCEVSRNGKWLAAGTWQGNGVRIWSLPDAVAFKDLPLIRGSTRVAFSPDNKRLVTGDTEAYRFWKTGTWDLEREIPSAMGGRHGMMAYSPRMTALMIACRGAELKVLNPLTLEEESSPDFDQESPLCFDPSGRLMITTGQSGGIFFWKLDEVRAHLDGMGLDWKHMPAFPKELPPPVVSRVVVAAAAADR